MRFQCLLCLLLASFACGQAVPPANPPATDKVPEVEVGPDDPVITVNGFCADPTQTGAACMTVITRAQFEKLTEALQPGMSLSLKLNVANAYARNLRMAAAAEKRGLDKTPAFEEEMRYARMQLLSRDLTRALQGEANNITEADLEEYYKKNESSYEQATLARIFVPRAKQSDAAHDDHEDAQAKADEEAMTKVAADLRARAANGEDPDKLQIEAYTAAGIPRTNSDTKMEKVRRAALPPRHEAVMDLKPGEVSEVFSDPGGAHFIYKMISKQTLTLEEAKTEIRGAISSQRYRDSMKNFQGDVVFSDAYFNPPGKPATPPQRNRTGRRKKPPAQSEDHD
ncbi:MAG: peptidylprolyl isomerase [Candidatus Sulfotelmatobacter sp.]